MVLLKTALKHKWGRNACLPIVGEIKISEEGTIEVESEEIAQQIEDLEIGFSIEEVVETTTTTTEVETTTTTTELITEKVEGDELNPEEETNVLHGESGEDVDLVFQHEKEIFFTSLEEKTVAELKELAKDFPGAEWRNLIKADLIAYLKEKLA